MFKLKFKISFTIFFLGLSIVAFSQHKGYYRTPAIFSNLVIFTAEGDLWKYDINNESTIRLTTHHGIENNPVFSPDGQWIAFTGQYEGRSEIYKMPVAGGVPIRLTFDDNYAKPQNWISEEELLYSTREYSTLPNIQLIKLNTETLSYERVPLEQAADGCYDESGNLYFTRLGFQGSQTKRYQGGTAQNLWKFDGNNEAISLTADYKGTSRDPMYYQNRIYFASDRDGTMNIWSMNMDGVDLKQHTRASGWDVKSPKINQSRIIYQNGADLWLYDISTEQSVKLAINLQSDFDQRRSRWIKKPGSSISSASLSPDGKIIALTARGRVFTNHTQGDRWLELTRKSGIRYKNVSFIDNTTIAYLSDESGEFEIWSASVSGNSKPRQITKNSKVLITQIAVDPQGKNIAYVDKDEILWLVDIQSGAIKQIDQSDYFGYGSLNWSIAGKYLTFVKFNIAFGKEIWVYNTQNGIVQQISSDRLDSYDPQWDKNSSWLYFVSDRTFNSKVSSPWGPRQPEPYFEKTAKIYALDLESNGAYPFLLKDPWIEEKEENKDEKDLSKKEKKNKAPIAEKLNIDWQQAKSRLFELPIGAKNIDQFAIAQDHLYWTESEPGEGDKTKLYALKIAYAKKYEPTLVMEGNMSFDISTDKKRIIILKSGQIFVANADGSKLDAGKTKISFSNWRFKINPVEDWKQMFKDAWRMERDYFYDKNLHNVDWVGIRKKHETLLDRLTDREELDDLVAQMVGELSALHTFVYGGDKRRGDDNINAGSLGARLVKDVAKGGYVIEHIYQHDPDFPAEASPLNQPHLAIKNGDLITAVNNVSVLEVSHINQLLANKVGVPVNLTIKDNNGQTNDFLITPVNERSERNLKYTEWEYSRRREVERQGNNEIGYIHLRNMGSNDMAAFVKQFYPVFDRQGLIIDVRHNGGGNIDSWIIEKLLRKAWFFWKARSGKPYWNMHLAFRGHLVVLCDQNTASDGEAFAEGVKRLKLGTVMGTRTWGGEIWLTSSNRLVDNGIATAAEFGVYTADGKWIIEGHGVDPDIEVDNLPYETFKGNDNQLNKAIKYLQDKIKASPVSVPQPPPYPDKSFDYNK